MASPTYPLRVERGIRLLGPDRYQVRVSAGTDPTTKRVQHVSKVVRTSRIAEVRRVKSQLEAEVREGRRGGGSGTLSELLDQWVEDRREGWATKTYLENRRKIDRVIGPMIGSTRLDNLTSYDLDRFYRKLSEGWQAGEAKPDGLSGTPLSARTVLQMHRILHSALRQARKTGKVSRNVAEDADLPKVQAIRPTPPDDAQVRQMIAAADKVERVPEFSTLLLVAAHTGARRGELCALTWGDVDAVDSILTIRHAIGTFAGGTEIKDPKTHAIREIELGPMVLEALNNRRERAVDAAKLVGRTIEDDCYVFSPDIDGRNYLRPDTLSHAFVVLRKMLERETGRPWPYRFHDLRHYAATAFLADGGSATDTAHRLGHSDASMVHKVYGHATKDRQRQLAESTEAKLF